MERLIQNVVDDEKHCKILNNLNVFTLKDLCSYFPYRYDNIEGSELIEGQVCTFEGKVISTPKSSYGGRVPRFSFEVMYGDHLTIEVVVFHRTYLLKQIQLNQVLTLRGKYNKERHSFLVNEILFQSLDACKGIKPIYALKSGIEQKDIFKYVKKALELVGNIEDVIPEELCKKYEFNHRDSVINHIHFPKALDCIDDSIHYMKYEQFYLFQLTMQYSKWISEKKGGIKKTFSKKNVDEYVASLPFDLTKDQLLTVNELLTDLQSEKAMYRFVQGDVGSGKTVVALIGMYATFLAGYQSAFMVPTEILAKQQFASLNNSFKKLGVRVELLTGSMKKKERDYVLTLLKEGYIDIIVGTHSLFQDAVEYHNLGFVVADEQHRFGVKQRKALKDKGDNVDFLLMSATPIPRTLAMSLYGDMDVSTIETMPSDRKGIETFFVPSSSMQSILPELECYLENQGQCYVVCPLVDSNSTLSVRDATSIYDGMKQYFSNRYTVGLLHGQMNDDEKANVMEQFLKNEIQIIVATTVIEVGINVLNANRMIIYNAERFGISQLHQLRGRVGRGSEKGICYLLSKTTDEDSKEKLEFLTTCHNGFDVSRYDLSKRGPGDLLGDRQSGVPTFTFGDLYKDAKILEQARGDVRELIASNCQDPVFLRQLDLIKVGFKKNNQYID